MTRVMTSLLKQERRRFARRRRGPAATAPALRAVRWALDSEQPALLLHAEVSGVEPYTERFGPEPARALRALLDARVSDAIRAAGQVFRSPGDGWIVLLAAGACELERWTDTVGPALAPRGAGFALAASIGAVELPGEADRDRPERILRSAQRRATPAPWGEVPRAPATPDLRAAAGALPLPLEELTRALAERLMLGGREIGLLAVAAVVYAAGKAAIPDDVLEKSAALSDTERDLLALYPRAGEALLRADAALAPAAPIVGALHAPWRRAPLAARILSVTVAYAAMTDARPHRPARPPAAALATLHAAAGEDFDPAVVRALAAVLADGEHSRHAS